MTLHRATPSLATNARPLLKQDKLVRLFLSLDREKLLQHLINHHRQQRNQLLRQRLHKEHEHSLRPGEAADDDGGGGGDDDDDDR